MIPTGEDAGDGTRRKSTNPVSHQPLAGVSRIDICADIPAKIQKG